MRVCRRNGGRRLAYYGFLSGFRLGEESDGRLPQRILIDDDLTTVCDIIDDGRVWGMIYCDIKGGVEHTVVPDCEDKVRQLIGKVTGNSQVHCRFA